MQRIDAVYASYFDELRAGDGEAACDLLTSAQQDQVVQEAGGGDCPTVVISFAGFYDDYYPKLQAIEVSGETATATDPGDRSQSRSSQEVQFELVDGEWLIANAG
jgi:hypothetical protein